jgi:hypothetical protein
MKQRCFNKNHPRYKDYGGRGIDIEPTWHSFKNFRNDMGTCPDKYILDRIDNSKGYYKDNCRWVSYQTSNENKRDYKSSTTGHRGISYVSTRQHWLVSITKDSKRIYIGTKKTFEGALELWSSYVNSSNA